MVFFFIVLRRTHSKAFFCLEQKQKQRERVEYEICIDASVFSDQRYASVICFFVPLWGVMPRAGLTRGGFVASRFIIAIKSLYNAL